MYNILIGRMRISQNLDFGFFVFVLFCFFAGPFRFFPLALLLSFLFALLFSLSSTTHILSVARKKLGIYNG